MICQACWSPVVCFLARRSQAKVPSEKPNEPVMAVNHVLKVFCDHLNFLQESSLVESFP